jgi:hypothetical protein
MKPANCISITSTSIAEVGITGRKWREIKTAVICKTAHYIERQQKRMTVLRILNNDLCDIPFPTGLQNLLLGRTEPQIEFDLNASKEHRRPVSVNPYVISG